MDAEHEVAALSKFLADQLLPPIGKPSRPVLRDHIRRSEASRVHFDALGFVCEELDSRGEAITGPLAEWRQEVADGRRRRPATKPIPPHRPANPAQLARDIHIQFTLEVLDRVGVPPRGSPISGCYIVSEASGLSEGTVERIWKACAWRTSFVRVMPNYWKAIAERTGLDQTH